MDKSGFAHVDATYTVKQTNAGGIFTNVNIAVFYESAGNDTTYDFYMRIDGIQRTQTIGGFIDSDKEVRDYVPDQNELPPPHRCYSQIVPR